jgi:hypothetical protein
MPIPGLTQPLKIRWPQFATISAACCFESWISGKEPVKENIRAEAERCVAGGLDLVEVSVGLYLGSWGV